MARLSRKAQETENARFLAAYEALWDEWLAVAAYAEPEPAPDPLAALDLAEWLGLSPAVACRG